MWTLNEALELIREIQPKCYEFGYHVTLGGGVLNKGESDKDLDLFFLIKNGNDGMRKDLKLFLFKKFGWLFPIRDSPDYNAGDPWHYSDMLMTTDESGKGYKRIDFFIR